MNLSKQFESTIVDVVGQQGRALFELYSTGMALGYTKEAKGKLYPRKDRIDKVLLNADITPVVHEGQPGNTNKYLTEQQLYDFMLEAKTEKCRPFRKWITFEVLPTIRKTGGYVQEDREREFLEKMFPTLSDDLKVKMVSELQQSVKVMKPKADYYDKVNSLKGLTNLRDTAKQIGVPEKKFIKFLLDKHFLYRDTTYRESRSPGKLLPYATHTKTGLFELKEVTFGAKKPYYPNEDNCVARQTFVTTKGKAYFLERLTKEGLITKKLV